VVTEESKRQVDLPNSLSSLPDLTVKHGKVITPVGIDTVRYLRDLPEFLIMFKEYALGK